MATPRGRRRPLAASVARGVALAAALVLARRLRSWLDVAEVQGGSMAPTLLHGDWLVVECRAYTRRAPRIGEIVLAPDPRNPARELIKRIAAVDPVAGTAELRGDAPGESTDSRTFGAVPLVGIRWRVIGRYRPVRRAALWLTAPPAEPATGTR